MMRLRRRVARGLLVAVCVLIGLWLIAPTFVVIPMSFTGSKTFQFPPPSWSTRWWDNFFTDPSWLSALWTSVRVALLVTVLATMLGTAAAFGLSRGRFRGRGVVRALLLTPMVVPVVVVAIGVYAVYLEWGLTGTIPGFVLAHTALATPFVVVTVSASLQTFDRRLESAAASLGASPWEAFRHVTLPLIAPGVLNGALFAFMTSFDETVVSLFMASPFERTLPVELFLSVTETVDPTIAVASTLIIAITTTALLLGAVAASRRGNRLVR